MKISERKMGNITKRICFSCSLIEVVLLIAVGGDRACWYEEHDEGNEEMGIAIAGWCRKLTGKDRGWNGRLPSPLSRKRWRSREERKQHIY